MDGAGRERGACAQAGVTTRDAVCGRVRLRRGQAEGHRRRAARREVGQRRAREDRGLEILLAERDDHCLRFLRADGTQRYVEAKGRSGEGAVEMTVNEFIQAGNHRDKYWLYVVLNCATVPTLYRIFNPFERLVAQQTGTVRISRLRSRPRLQESM